MFTQVKKKNYLIGNRLRWRCNDRNAFGDTWCGFAFNRPILRTKRDATHTTNRFKNIILPARACVCGSSSSVRLLHSFSSFALRRCVGTSTELIQINVVRLQTNNTQNYQYVVVCQTLVSIKYCEMPCFSVALAPHVMRSHSVFGLM